MRYFDHDTTAASDDLIMALRLEHGGAAVDCYWAIIEQIYREERPAIIDDKRPETKALSVRLAIAYEVLITYVKTMIEYGLLVVVENIESDCLIVTSERAQDNITAYQNKCEKARLNGAKGGKVSKRKANAKRTLSGLGSGLGSDREAKKRKESNENLYGSQLLASSEAESAKAAPLSACPTCDAKLTRTGSHKPNGETLYLCDLCGTEVWQ